jgi:GTP-binding protein HflX
MVEMVRAVDDVLEEIGAGDVPRLLALNKADLLDDDRRRELGFRHPDAVLVSALTGEGMDTLADRVQEAFRRSLREVVLLLPYDEGGRLAELHELADDLQREDTAEGVRVSARLPETVAARYERFAVQRA